MSEQFSRRAAALIVDVDLDRLPAWEPGPLPVEDGDTGEARSGYFNERAAQALYGPGRLHRTSSEPHEGFDVLGVEVLRVSGARRTRNALLVVHGRLRADGLDLVRSLSRLADVGVTGAWLDGLLDGAGRVVPSVKRAATLALVTPAGRAQAPLSAEFKAWSPELQWLWLLASATPVEEYAPPPEWGEALAESLVRLSRGWSALVLRDGAALLGSGSDIGKVYRLFEDTESRFRSIYLDGLLLGHIQRLRLSQISDDLAALGDPVRYPDRLRELEGELTEFRNVFWWQQLGPHWHGNELLRAYQQQQEIPQLFAQVIEALEDYSRQAQTAATQRTSALLGTISVVGLPFAFAIGLLQVLRVDDWRWVFAALAAAAAVTVFLLLTRAGKTLLRPWRT